MPVANLIFDSLWSSRPPEQMSCLWLPSVAGVVPPCSGLKRTPSSDFRPFFFSSSPPRESVLPSNEIFRCAVCWSVWPWPTVASLDVYLLRWCHCLCWGVWLWRNHPKAVVKCICRIKQNFRMPENAFAWCFIIVDGGNKSISIDAYTNSRHF